MIGVMLLVGIVKKNATMMVDVALETERTSGSEARDAIHHASKLRLRMRSMNHALPPRQWPGRSRSGRGEVDAPGQQLGVVVDRLGPWQRNEQRSQEAVAVDGVAHALDDRDIA
jgi:hypothetical protein